MELIDFYLDRGIEMDFVIKSSATPIYINTANMINRLRVDSKANYLRYRRLEEIKAIKLVDLKGRTLSDISIERG